MAKMRGVKPETFTDSKVVRLSPLARYLFIGLWTQACDNGHVDNDEIELKIRLLPADNADVASLLGEMEALKMIARDDEYITVLNLAKHQRLDRRYFKTCDKSDCLPPENLNDSNDSPDSPSEDTTGARRAHDESAKGSHDEGERKVKGKEGERKVKGPLPRSWTPNPKHEALAASLGLDVTWEANQFTDKAIASGWKYLDWDRAFNNWLRNTKKYNDRDGVRPASSKPAFDPWEANRI